MGVPHLEQQVSITQTDTYPLLMEQSENITMNMRIIDIPRSANDASSSNYDRISNVLDPLQQEERPSSIPEMPVSQPSTSSSSTRQNSGSGRHRRNPLNSGLWICIELVLTLGQIIAAIVVLSLSRHEHPLAPLFSWVVGYASGCIATVPLLYWRYYHSNLASEQDSGRHRPNLNVAAGPFAFSITRTSEGGSRQTNAMSPRGNGNAGITSARLKVLVEYFKMALDCFFAIWFVIGNIWIFGGRSSAAEAPSLYRICIVFLSFSCVGYAMPLILCTTICCCLPCIISFLGYRVDLAQPRGATPESINALPTYKFKLKKSRSGDDNGSNSGCSDGGVVAAGTEKEHMISGEDAVCCICLAKYMDDDLLRELPCSHFFHKDCVDKWLKINASCPLCKTEVGEKISGTTSEPAAGILRSLSDAQENLHHIHNDRRANSGLANNVL